MGREHERGRQGDGGLQGSSSGSSYRTQDRAAEGTSSLLCLGMGLWAGVQGCLRRPKPQFVTIVCLQLFVQQQSQMDAKRLCGSLMVMLLSSSFFIHFLGEPQALHWQPSLPLAWRWVLNPACSRPSVPAILRTGFLHACVLETLGKARVLLSFP